MIKDALRELLDEQRREQPHVSGEDDEIDSCIVKRRYQFSIVIFALASFTGQDHGHSARVDVRFGYRRRRRDSKSR